MSTIKLKENDIFIAFNSVNIVKQVVERTNLNPKIFPKNVIIGDLIKYQSIYPIYSKEFETCDASYVDKVINGTLDMLIQTENIDWDNAKSVSYSDKTEANDRLDNAKKYAEKWTPEESAKIAVNLISESANKFSAHELTKIKAKELNNTDEDNTVGGINWNKYKGVLENISSIKKEKIINGIYKRGNLVLLARLLNMDDTKSIYNTATRLKLTRDNLIPNKIKNKYTNAEDIAIRVLKEECNLPWNVIAKLFRRTAGAISVNYYTKYSAPKKIISGKRYGVCNDTYTI